VNLERPREDLGEPATIAQVRRGWRLKVVGIAAGNAALTTTAVVMLHALGVA
jgi:hypothetical protein